MGGGTGLTDDRHDNRFRSDTKTESSKEVERGPSGGSGGASSQLKGKVRKRRRSGGQRRYKASGGQRAKASPKKPGRKTQTVQQALRAARGRGVRRTIALYIITNSEKKFLLEKVTAKTTRD